LVPSPAVSAPIRDGTFESPSTSITLETWIADSRSRMPPLTFFCGFGRVWRLTMPMPSTTTRLLSGSTCSTRPRLPRSLPARTSTVSFFLIRTFAIVDL
jgi:hypothetical protein